MAGGEGTQSQMDTSKSTIADHNLLQEIHSPAARLVPGSGTRTVPGAAAAEPGGIAAVASAMNVWLFFCLIIAAAAMLLNLSPAQSIPALILAAIPAALARGMGDELRHASGRLFLIAAWIILAAAAAVMVGPFEAPIAALFMIAPLLAFALGDRDLGLDALIAVVFAFSLAVIATGIWGGGVLRTGNGALDWVMSTRIIGALIALAAVILGGLLALAGATARTGPLTETPDEATRFAANPARGTFRTGPDGDIARADPGIAALLQRRTDALWGARAWALFAGADQARMREAIAAAAGRGENAILRGLSAGGNGGREDAAGMTMVDALVRPVSDEKGAGQGLLRRPDVEIVLVPAAARAAEPQGAGKAEHHAAQTEFAAVLTHELRTPLNAILGYSELIAINAGPKLSGRAQTWLGLVQVSGQRMLALIDSALQWARLEAGTEPMDRVAVELDAMLKEAIAIAGGLEGASERHIAFAPDAPAIVQGDPQALRQIAVNFLANAVKFAPPGATIDVRMVAGPGSAGFEIRNPAEGVSEADIARLAEPFVRKAGARTGTGLGLAIAKKLAAAMGGTMELSALPAGSFTARAMFPKN